MSPGNTILGLDMPGFIVSGLYYAMYTAHFMRRRFRAQEEEEEAALGFVNGHLFVSSATKICPNFANQTTTFLEKKTDLTVWAKSVDKRIVPFLNSLC